MNRLVGKIGTINQGPAHANALSTPPIGCVLDLSGLPGAGNKIYDRSPYGSIGTITGATWVRTPGGLWCLSFDGDDFVDCGLDSSLDFGTGSFSLAIWFNTGTKSRQLIQKKKSGSPYTGMYMSVDANGYGYLYTYGTAASNVIIGTVDLTDSKWHLLIGVRNSGDNLYLYVDGASGATPVASTDQNITYTAEELEIGRSESGTPIYFVGSIALPRIYNRALSVLEIQNHFNREKHLFGVW